MSTCSAANGDTDSGVDVLSLYTLTRLTHARAHKHLAVVP